MIEEYTLSFIYYKNTPEENIIQFSKYSPKEDLKNNGGLSLKFKILEFFNQTIL